MIRRVSFQPTAISARMSSIGRVSNKLTPSPPPFLFIACASALPYYARMSNPDDISREHLAMPGDQLKFVADFAKTYLADVEPYTDETSMGGGVIAEKQWGEVLRAPSDLTVLCNSTKYLNTDTPGYTSIHVSDRSFDSSLTMSSDGTLDYTAIADGNELYDKEGVPSEEALQDPDFIKQIGFMIEGIESVKMPKKEYLRHELPQTLTTTPLTVEEQHAASAELNSTTALFRPEYRMDADTGESWFMSNLQTDGGRSYALLYAHDGTPFVAYTSQSHGAWRLLPRLGRPGNDAWHDKGAQGEGVINLPIAFQKGLQDMQESTREEHIPITRDILYKELGDITQGTYDAFLSGAESESIWLDDDTHSTLLPQTFEHSEPLYRFESSLYGPVDAHVVPSRDDSIDYLVFTRTQTGDRWIGMAQPKNAQMLESFILDHSVRGHDLYIPPIEYAGSLGEKGYQNNAQRAAQSIAVRALRGEV